MSGTIERVIMNKSNALIGIGIRVRFADKYPEVPIGNLAGYSVQLQPSKIDGWLLFSGEVDADGPYLFIGESKMPMIEDLGPL